MLGSVPTNPARIVGKSITKSLAMFMDFPGVFGHYSRNFVVCGVQMCLRCSIRFTCLHTPLFGKEPVAQMGSSPFSADIGRYLLL